MSGSSVPARSELNEDKAGFDRMVFFSDGVFAIAITLLAIEVRLPAIENPAELGSAVINLLPKALIYAISFMVIGRFWIAHHRMFRYIVRYDGVLLALNLVFLMFVAFLPVPSSALGEHGPELPIVLFFAMCFTLAALSELVIWWYASSRHRLIAPELDPVEVRHLYRRIWIVVGVFAASMLVAVWSPTAAIVSWLVVLQGILTVVERRHTALHS